MVGTAVVVTAVGVGSASSATTVPDEELEDELVILCTPQEEWCELARGAFEEETGIETEYVRLSAGEAIARLEAEGDDPSFDVWFGGPSVGPATAAPMGFIEPYVSANAAEIPEEFKEADGTWTGIYLGALGFCSNTELLEELEIDAPASFDDLLDPALDDNVAVADLRTSGTAATLAGNVVAVLGSEDDAIEYFTELDGNIFQYTRSGSAPGQMAATGEVAVALIFAHDCIAIAEETGVPLELTYPEEGTAFEIGQVSVIANAEHPNAAKAFVDWALTAEAQEMAVDAKAYQVPTNPDAEVPEQSPRLEDLTLAEDYTPQLAEELRAGEFVNRWADEVRGGAEAPTD